MPILSIATLSTSLLLTLLCILVLRKNAQSGINRAFAILCLSSAIWQFCYSQAYMKTNPEEALMWFKIGYPGVFFIAVAYFHFSIRLLNIKLQLPIIFFYCLGAFFVFLFRNTNLLMNNVHSYSWGFYPRAGTYHPIFLIIFLILLNISICLLSYFFIFKRKQISKKLYQQLKYILLALAIYTLASMDFLPNYGIKIYPLGFIPATLFVSIIAYSIVHYHLLDIRLALSRAGIFLFVYSLVLGLPFLLGYKYGLWKNATWLMLFLATTGPFIYLFIQRKAEAALLKEERKTQDILNRASIGMRTVRNLLKLLGLIVDILAENLQLDHVAIYLDDPENGQYVSKTSNLDHTADIKIAKNNPLVRRLEETKYPIVYEELQLASDPKDGEENLREMIRQMAELQSSMIVPVILDDVLLGFIALGERKDKRVYSADLINVLSVLGNQAALAIENCKHIQRVQEEGLTERMVSLDHMSSSMAHEIDNPMHIVRTSLSFVKSILLRDPRVAMPEEIRQDFDDALARSLNASERVSSMIKAILDYSRMGTGKLEAVHIREALEGFLHLIGPQIKGEKVEFTHEIENDLPVILGDRIQMEEVFMNFVRNSLHAVRRNEEKKISLKIFRKTETVIRIECKDNGYGIPQEIINDIFLSSMTTKGSSEGTGLGLYRVRKIVDLFCGKVWAESGGKDKGATFIVDLPAYSPSNSTDSRKGE